MTDTPEQWARHHGYDAIADSIATSHNTLSQLQAARTQAWDRRQNRLAHALDVVIEVHISTNLPYLPTITRLVRELQQKD